MERCQTWLARKGRNCGGAALPGSNYCGNHQTTEERVVCPLDPSHTVSQTKLTSHLNKCPTAKLQHAAEGRVYYSPGLNAGSDDDEGDSSSSSKREAIEYLPSHAFEELVERILCAHASCSSLIAFNDNFARPSACSNWLSAQVDRRHPLQEKHIVQQASMLGNLEQFGLLRTREREKKTNILEGVIEFGAGRGYLSQMLSECYSADNMVLVERRSYKFKADRTLRYCEGVSLARLRVDIEDLNLDAVESLQGCNKVVAVSKHLCGPATDLALRCCFASKRSRMLVTGLGVTTCCHHLCQWKAYVNKEFFRSLGFSRAEFEAITWLTSWALRGELDEKAELGVKCKELLDMGRLLWLEKQQGWSCRMVRYVAAQTSPENKLIMAKRQEEEEEEEEVLG